MLLLLNISHALYHVLCQILLITLINSMFFFIMIDDRREYRQGKQKASFMYYQYFQDTYISFNFWQILELQQPLQMLSRVTMLLFLVWLLRVLTSVAVLVLALIGPI